jgi:hypothetical protein
LAKNQGEAEATRERIKKIDKIEKYRPPESKEDIKETKTGKVDLCMLEPEEEKTDD